MTDATTPLRVQVDRSGYAFNLGVAATIESSAAKQKWRVRAVEAPWSKSLEKAHGFVDIAIERDKAIGVIECKKVNGGERLVFLMKSNQSGSVARCRLDIYQPDRGADEYVPGIFETRYGTAECNMVTGSAESAYCVGSKGGQSAHLNLDSIASELLTACEGLLGDWDIGLPGDPTVCIPIVVTNAELFTCTFDPTKMDLASGNLPSETEFEPVPFVRFRKAFRQGAGTESSDEKDIAGAVAEGERTVFVVDTRHLVPFLAGLRGLFCPTKGGQRMLVSAD